MTPRKRVCKDYSNKTRAEWDLELGTTRVFGDQYDLINCMAYYEIQGCYPPHICPSCSKCTTSPTAYTNKLQPACPANSTLSGSTCNCNAGYT